MGPREAEIGQDAVAHEPCNETVVASDRARTRILKSPDDVAHVFRIDPRGYLGRTHEIAEHHSQLAALGRVWSRRACRHRPRRFAESRYGLQQTLAVAQRYAQFHEVGVG